MADDKKSKLVEIRLVAMGENSALTGGQTLARGDVVKVPQAAAAAAVATGRWALAEAEPAADIGSGGA